MSDNEAAEVPEKPFCIDRAKQGRAACKKCKEKCLTGELRIAKLAPSPFGSGKMKNWHHLDCIFEQFLKQRTTTKRIECSDDLDGWDELNSDDQKDVSKRIHASEKAIAEKYGLKAPSKQQNETTPSKASPNKKSPAKRNSSSSRPGTSNSSCSTSTTSDCKALRFKDFRSLVADISSVSSYTEKTNLVSSLFSKGSDGKGFKGDITQWCRLLLPGVIKRIYNLQSKQLIKLFSKIFHTDQTTMMDHLKQGDIGETIQHFFEASKKFKPAAKSVVTVQEVDDFLEELSKLTKEDEQTSHFEAFARKCTSNDLKLVIRLVKHDLRMNAGAKHILQGVHPDAYSAYQSSRDLNSVISRCLGGPSKSEENPSRVKASINLMTPVQPMLAEPCKSIDQAMKKCPNGMYAEIKYDGERVQVHKHGTDFKYYSRHLKPVLPHKVQHFKDYIPKAFPHAKDLIIDSEILMIDTVTNKPLPFGSLGVHKKTEFKDANVCLFVFDCMYYNGESLVNQSIEHRRKILLENMSEIPNHIMFSEAEIVNKSKQLSSLIAKVFQQGLEGLVLKDIKSIYKPGKRNWLKVKKDYLHDGAMADTADLIVLGAWYGTGKKAGMKSVFLMGCYNPNTKKYYTVTKVHTGHDDKTLEQLQTELKMIEISSNPSKVPDWLVCTKTMIPDFVAENPKQQPVWEITGAEFTQHDVHTADGISIRFPRVTKIRGDKNWKTATTLEELKNLFQTSKESTDVRLLMEVDDTSDSKEEVKVEPKKAKQKHLSDYIKKPDSHKKRRRESSETSDGLRTPKTLKNDRAEAATSESAVTEIDDYDKIKEPLPNIFETVKLLLEEGVDVEFAEWIRRFKAYGGTVLKNKEWETATHVLHLDDTVAEQNVKSPINARHVFLEWIEDSITNGGLEDFRPYTVTCTGTPQKEVA